jgi:molecular chaperone DnaJ
MHGVDRRAHGRSVDARSVARRGNDLEGVARRRGVDEQRGDQQVIVNVEIPTRLSEEQRAHFEALAASMGTEVRPQEKGFFDTLKEVFGG